jgi:hypothetical protein
MYFMNGTFYLFIICDLFYILGLSLLDLLKLNEWMNEYCDVFDWRPSLLGNHSRNSSMDTVIIPVLLRYMVTNSRRASVSIVAGSVKAIHASQSMPVGLQS